MALEEKTDKKLRYALFDFDGTLVDTIELIHQSMKHATSSVLGREFPRATLLANVGQPLPAQMLEFDPDRVDELMESYRAYNDEAHETYIKSYPDIPASLKRLKDAGVEIAVVTSKRRHSVELALTSFPELKEAVDRFVTLEDTKKHKPDPEPLLRGLEMLGGSDPKEAAYVGDAPFDVNAAKAAGMRSVAVSWGAFEWDVLEKSDPDHLTKNVDGAVDYLLELA